MTVAVVAVADGHSSGLAPGVDLARANGMVRATVAGLAQRFPSTNEFKSATVEPYSSMGAAGRPESRRVLSVLLSLAAAVLLGLVLVLIGYAAIIEAFFRQSSASTTLRLGVAGMNAVALTAYLTFAGRTTRTP